MAGRSRRQRRYDLSPHGDRRLRESGLVCSAEEQVRGIVGDGAEKYVHQMLAKVVADRCTVGHTLPTTTAMDRQSSATISRIVTIVSHVGQWCRRASNVHRNVAQRRRNGTCPVDRSSWRTLCYGHVPHYIKSLPN